MTISHLAHSTFHRATPRGVLRASTAVPAGTGPWRAGADWGFNAELLDKMAQAVIATDLAGTVVFWNPAAEALYGWSREEALGRNILDLTPAPEMVEQAGAIMARLCQGESWSGEFQVQRRDGTRFWVEVIDSPVHDEDGRMIGVMGLSADITARRQAEEAQRDALREQKALAEQNALLVREMNHRIKNSLQIVSSMLYLQASSTAEPAARQAIHVAAGRVAAIARVHQQLDTLRKVNAVEFGDLLRALMTGLEQPAGQGVAIEVDADQSTLATEKATSLALVANELVTNAIKHAYLDAADGTVTVEFRCLPEGGCRLTVADAGVGLPEDFDPAASRGLGMKIVQALVGRLGGRLEVDRGEGETRFVVHVPQG